MTTLVNSIAVTVTNYIGQWAPTVEIYVPIVAGLFI